MVESTLNHDLEDLFSRCRPIAVFYKFKHYSFWKKFYFCSSLTQSDIFGSGDINTDIAVEKSTDNVYDD